MSCVSDDHDKNGITVPCSKYHEAFYDDTDYVVCTLMRGMPR